MTDLPELSVAEALQAYAETGLKPMPVCTYRRGCACVLFAWGVNRGMIEKPQNEDIVWSSALEPVHQHFGEYSHGVMCGFDDDRPDEYESPRYLAGYARGKEIATAVFGKEGAK